MKYAVVVGSINMDLVASAGRIPVAGETISGLDFQTHPGGKGANQAVAIARLGAPVHMIGRVGDDRFGAELRQYLESAGVDISGVGVSAGPTGVAVIVVTTGGENTIVVVPGANALLTPADIDAQIGVLRGASMVLAQLEIPLETVEFLAEICSREQVPLMLDPAPAQALSAESLRRVDWFTPNEVEARFYLDKLQDDQTSLRPEEMAEQLFQAGVNNVVLKLGSRGAYVRQGNSQGELVLSFDIKAIDSTGAGDCFNGAFATALMQGSSAIEGARFATAAAAISVTRAGAQPSLPTLEEVESLLQSSPALAANGTPGGPA